MQADGEQRFTVNLRKPMGMVLAERSDGKVFVESITEGGNAAEQGSVQVKEEIAVTYRTMLCGNKIATACSKSVCMRHMYLSWCIVFACGSRPARPSA